MPETLIVPGLLGSGEGHWQRIWAEEHDNAAMIEQDDWSRPVLEKWLARLEQALERSDGAFLVAHSLGSVLVARLAERPSANKVLGALLVAPCDLPITESIHPGLIRFGDMPDKPLPFPALVIASLNDTYMPIDQARHHASRWACDITDIGNAGHINIASGYGRWPQGHEFLDRLKNTPFKAGNKSAGIQASHVSKASLPLAG